MRHLFILDPLDLLHVEGDTSIAFIHEAWRRGHVVETCEVGDLGQRGGEPFARARVTTAGASEWWSTADSRDVPISDYGAVWMRKDPPLDDAYLFATLLMSRAEGPVMVNDPAALRDQNEKLFALEFPELCPTTLVSRRVDQLLAFRDELGGEMIVKPLDGNGGRDVFHLTPGDRNARAIIEAGTSSGQRLLLAQEYVPSVRAGDKRIILIEGEPAGAVLRVPAADEARANLHVGGRAVAAELTARDREICARIGPRLRELGVIFAGIDVLGEVLTEINITSPTGLREIEQLSGVALEAGVMDAVEARRRP
ncbi:MAG: glutathione synthase [Planctomycetota bacterium]|nr:glutathione synthase [Planctomycetota bacterium]MEC9048452.1 glutathione synthase [Planctomycetota bacterium]